MQHIIYFTHFEHKTPLHKKPSYYGGNTRESSWAAVEGLGKTLKPGEKWEDFFPSDSLGRVTYCDIDITMIWPN